MKIRILLNCAMALLLVALTADFGGRPLLNIVATLEQQTFDWRLSRGAGEGRKNAEIVIVDIDRDSLRAVGGWPWPRDRMAQILDQLFDKYRVRAAAFTFSFAAPDDGGLAVFDEVLREVGDGAGFAVRNRLHNLRRKFDYDGALAAALKERQALLGYSFDHSARVEGALPSPVSLFDYDSKKIPDSRIADGGEDWVFYRGYAGNLPSLLDAAAGAGYADFAADSDGLVRRAPLLARYAKKTYESLALAMLRRADNPGQILNILTEDGGDIESLRAGRYEMPLNRAGEMYFNFLGAGGPAADYENTRGAAFRYISAHKVIGGAVAEEMLRDKIAIVGSSAEALRDIYSTPLNSAMPGAELLATQMANIMDGEVLRRPSSADTLALLALLAVALLAAVVSAPLGPVYSSLLTVALCGVSVYLNLSFWDDRLVVNMVAPLLVLIGLFLWNAISGFVFEWRASRNLQSTFGQYVPPELAKRMGQKKTISMEGESREMSVLFSDVRNFTSISETFSPQDLTKLMNRMLTALSRAIHEHGGTVDKFIGDAVMAFWNAPLDDEEHAKNAVLSAMSMQAAMEELSAQLEKEGHLPMRLGVGVCSGEANVGNMGSELRMAYTAMGDTVNVASRVEGLTKYYKIGILVTESTYELCRASDIAFRVVDSVRVKGRARALTIYEPLGDAHLLSPERRAALEMYAKMRDEYVRGDFAAARDSLAEYRAMEPADGLGEVYEERIAGFLQNPPAEWEGVTNFETK
ncbi:MAG: CHASE2 domain-containing protein [Gammaproteobacteria bacterium]